MAAIASCEGTDSFRRKTWEEDDMLISRGIRHEALTDRQGRHRRTLRTGSEPTLKFSLLMSESHLGLLGQWTNGPSLPSPGLDDSESAKDVSLTAL